MRITYSICSHSRDFQGNWPGSHNNGGIHLIRSILFRVRKLTSYFTVIFFSFLFFFFFFFHRKEKSKIMTNSLPSFPPYHLARRRAKRQSSSPPPSEFLRYRININALYWFFTSVCFFDITNDRGGFFVFLWYICDL